MKVVKKVLKARVHLWVLLVIVIAAGTLIVTSRIAQKVADNDKQKLEELQKKLDAAEAELTAEREKPEVTVSITTVELKRTEFITMQYPFEVAERVDNSNATNFFTKFVKGKNYIYTAEGIMKLGVDFGDNGGLLKVEEDSAEKTYTVRIPAAEILVNDVFGETVQRYDIKTAKFEKNEVQNDERNEFEKTIKEKMAEKAVAGGWLKEAQKEVGEQIKALIEQMPIGDHTVVYILEDAPSGTTAG
ncbi:MAG: DUF4230 domain-containing protein [Oscillospiraceae bacterium]|nr:DUF4230 domain-containing protein [Oscillospiraceae bacterium]